jgi:hypothetical protein
MSKKSVIKNKTIIPPTKGGNPDTEAGPELEDKKKSVIKIR